MGLATVKNKQRIGKDPRNINWVKDTNRFGFKFLSSYGWAPGLGLGKNNHGKTENVSAFCGGKRFIPDVSLSLTHLNDLNDIFARLNNLNSQYENSKYNSIFKKSYVDSLSGSLSKKFVRGEFYKTDFNKHLKKND
ncbi:telomerase inhibitor [Pneumocystis jirovecii RU7]|uniref:G-patch domain-containing protein n=1 Tax=Pneumocystis jirovecii (strain RU7) TaxID=1408657 RepID=A0A0W4ZUV8_PNEJ7|nr:telomerase inhibitor [Pneumocystis jirovecii RU7]KTW32132.1 hypothetical protein T551_00814 [Pneumocystis jirovecii RU7]